MKKRILLLAVAFLVIFTGCTSSSDDGKKTSTGDSKKVGLSISTLDNPFFVDIKEAAEAQAKKDGLEIEVLNAKSDAATQASDIETLVNKNVKVILVNAVDSKAVASAVKAALDKGIKVISVDRSIEGVKVDSHIASDNVEGGKMAGEYIIKQLGDKGDVIELEGELGTSAANERGKGFNDAIKGKLKVVAKQSADFDRAKGLSVMENLAQANKGYKAVFAHNDEMILGALEAIKDNKIITVGVDGTEDGLKAIKDGKLTASVAQQPVEMGKKAVEQAKKIVDGQKADETVPVELILVDKNNVDEFSK